MPAVRRVHRSVVFARSRYFNEHDMDVFRTPPVSEGDSSRVWCADAFRLSLVSVGRALARCGNAYIKKNDLEQAMIFFNKSMSEHRDPAVVKKALEVSELSKLVFT